MISKLEDALENFLFASRWLLAPMYAGLVLCLALLLVKFGQEFLHIVPHTMEMKDTELVLKLLSLVDLTLAANLILMVVFAGYENFVSKIDVAADSIDRPDWMGRVDYSGLKLKIIASIVAISAIQMLKSFLDVEHYTDRDLGWQLAIHFGFVLSGVFLAMMDWMGVKAAQQDKILHADDGH